MSASAAFDLIASAQRSSSPLKARRLGIRTHQEAVVYMRTDCHVCRSEGLTPQSRVLLSANGREIIATLHQVTSDLLGADEAGLSEAAWDRLEVAEGDADLAQAIRTRSNRSAAFDAESTGTGSIGRRFTPSSRTW